MGHEIDAARVEWIGQTVPWTIHREHSPLLCQPAQDRRPLERFAETAMDEQERRALRCARGARFDDLGSAPPPPDATGTMTGYETLKPCGLRCEQRSIGHT